MVVRHVKRCHVRSTVLESSHRVRFGRGTTVSGWLGTAGGVALGGQQVQVMTAPDNGSNGFTQVTSVTTAANGTWSAKLPPGPARLVQAVYGGASTVEPTATTPIKLLVPAKVKIRVTPHVSRWGGTVAITGRVFGGYIPGGKLLRLRIGVEGVKGTVGIPNVAKNGRFRTTWTFTSGRGMVRYWFAVSTLGEPDYAFSPGSSRRAYVTVGPG
jgi:hypothetical protein